jgi:hypothetical protein
MAHAGARSVRTRHALDKAADEGRLILRVCSVNDCAARSVVPLYGPGPERFLSRHAGSMRFR